MCVAGAWCIYDRDRPHAKWRAHRGHSRLSQLAHVTRSHRDRISISHSSPSDRRTAAPHPSPESAYSHRLGHTPHREREPVMGTPNLDIARHHARSAMRSTAAFHRRLVLHCTRRRRRCRTHAAHTAATSHAIDAPPTPRHTPPLITPRLSPRPRACQPRACRGRALRPLLAPPPPMCPSRPSAGGRPRRQG